MGERRTFFPSICFTGEEDRRGAAGSISVLVLPTDLVSVEVNVEARIRILTQLSSPVTQGHGDRCTKSEMRPCRKAARL